MDREVVDGLEHSLNRLRFKARKEKVYSNENACMNKLDEKNLQEARLELRVELRKGRFLG